ncbi:MAG TPA: D-alanyl-D-alanine carboxypeptidase family protein [Candidatus Dormibacteraeota bacterium]
MASKPHEMEPILVDKVATGGRRSLDVVVLVPPAVSASPAGPVSILLHLHGISVLEGHHYEQMLHKGIVPPEYDMAAQLDAFSATPGSRMIALLPAGKTVPTSDGKFTVDFGGFDTDAMANETVSRLVKAGQLPAGSTAGGVVLSAHSGGGFEAKAAARGKKVAGMFAFESIHGDLDEYRTLLQGKLNEDLLELQSLAPSQNAVPATVATAFQAQARYLRERGFRFVGFAGSNKGYRDRFRELDASVHGPRGWIAKHESALRQAAGSHYSDIRQMLEANYQFNIDQTGDHFKMLAGGHLEQALSSLSAAPGAAQAPIVHAEKPSTPKPPVSKKPSPASHPGASHKKKRKQFTSTGPLPIPAGAIRSDQLPAFGNEQQTTFRRAVYDKQQQLSLAADEERKLNDEPTRFSLGVPDKQLGSVEGLPIHKTAEADANSLLHKARAAHDVAKKNGDARALACTSIGISNAYRSPATDFDAWQDAFKTHYDSTAKRRRAQVGGPFGDAAVAILAAEMFNFKASPGFSNHTQGLAMDFTTHQDGQGLTAKSAQKELWRDSWLYLWLRKNAHDSHFAQLPTEEWHWDHQAGAPSPAGAEAAAVPHPASAPAATIPSTPARPSPKLPAAERPAGPAIAPTGGKTGEVSITFGPNAKQDAVAASSLAILADILRAAGLSKATITSTARTAADQARAMYQNLVGAGVAAQRALYGPAGRKVIDTYVALQKEGKSPKEIEEGMRDRIVEIGPSKVSRHCGDFKVLNVFDVGPLSLGGPKARKAFAEAAEAEVGKRVSKFIPWPKDPGDHLEIKPSSAPEVATLPPAAPTVAAPKPAAPEPAAAGPAALDWLKVLPYAKRDKKQRITPKAYGVNVPALELTPLTAEQQQVVEQIRGHRAKLPSLLADKNVGKQGVSYHDSVQASETATPKELQDASAPGSRARKLVWDEVRKEGGLDSLNTYDSEIVTWGKGFSAKSHSMNDVLLTMFKSDPEAKAMLLQAGIALTANDWMVVNGESGAIETGDNALRLLQFDRQLLSVFITLGSDPKHSAHALEAQWAWIRKRTANVPEYAYDWPADSIQLMAHLSQWMPALRWGSVDYKATGGEIYQIILVYLRHFLYVVRGAEAPKPGSGAHLISATWDMVSPGHRFYAFAGGAGITAIKANAGVVTAAQVDSDTGLAGHIVIPIPPPHGDAKSTHLGSYVPRSSRYYDLGP